MKKFILLLLIIAATLGAHAQNVIALRYATGEYNKYSETWNYNQWEPTYLTFTYVGNQIFVNDRARSVYTLVKRYDQTGYTAFDAVDEKNKSCMLKFQYNTNTKSNNLTVFYGNLCYVYDLE